MQTLLEKALAAEQVGDWLSVSQCLQDLILGEDVLRSSPLDAEEWAQANELSLRVLECGDSRACQGMAMVFQKFGAQSITPLRHLVEDQEADFDQRWLAGQILSKIKSSQTIALFVSWLNSPDEETRTIAASILVTVGESAIAALIPLLEQPESRFAAARALAQICHPAIVAPLLSVVQDEDAAVRTVAIQALSSFQDPSIHPVLMAALQDPVASVRKAAVVALGSKAHQVSDVDLVSHLQPLLLDLHPEICQQAAIALGRLGTDRAAAVLFDVLRSPLTPKSLQTTIIQALSWMESLTALNYLQQALTQVDAVLILDVVRQLGQIENPQLKPKACQILLAFFHTEHPATQVTSIRQALAYSWGELGDTAAAEALAQLQADAQPSVQIHAIAAIAKLNV